jgi:Ni2+-binding GTPase involved in maturation of urease and hydrogenase
LEDKVGIADMIGEMKVVTVSGAHKGVGKTALTELLLQRLPGFAAIKITINDLYTSVSDEEKEIMVDGKDTFRMKKSGAHKVVWVKTTEHSLPGAMEEALSMIGTPRGLLIEGNSILNHITPTVAFFVIDDATGQMKPSRINALKKADLCIINQKNGAPVKEEALENIRSLNPKLHYFSLDLASPLASKSEDVHALEHYLKEMLS